MPFDLPDAPVLDQTVTTPDGTVYVWDGTMWKLQVVSGAYVPLDGTLPMTGDLLINSAGGTTPLIQLTNLDSARRAQIQFVSGLSEWKIGAESETGGNGYYSCFAVIDQTYFRLIVHPSVVGTPVVPIHIEADGALTTGMNGALVFRATVPVGDIVRFEDSTGAEVGSIGALGSAAFTNSVSAYSLQTRSGIILWEDAAGITQTLINKTADVISIYAASGLGHRPIAMFGEVGYPTAGEHVSELHFNAKKYYWGPYQNGIWVKPDDFFGSWDGEALTVNGSPDTDAPGTFHDATLRLTANTQAWDLIGATPDSGSAPGTFILADATTGTRRLIIDPGATDSATAVQITSAGDLLVHGVPVGGAGGAFLPIDGSAMMTGPLKLALDATLGFFWEQRVDSALNGSLSFLLNGTAEKFRIASGNAAPLIYDEDSNLSIGGRTLHFLGGSDGMLTPGSGPQIVVSAVGDMYFKAGVNASGFTSWYFVDDAGTSQISIGCASAGVGSITTDNITAYDTLAASKTIKLGGHEFAYTDITISGITSSPNIFYIAPPPLFDPVDVGSAIQLHGDLGSAVTPNENFYHALKHNWTSRDQVVKFGYWDETGLHPNALAIEGALDTAGNYNSASISLTSGAQSWKIEAEDAGSSTPSAFSIGDVTTGTRRLVIDPVGNLTVGHQLAFDIGASFLVNASPPGAIFVSETLFRINLPPSPTGAFVVFDITNDDYVLRWDKATKAFAIFGALQVDDALNCYGPYIYMANAPTAPEHVANKAYVDTVLASAAGGAAISDVAPASPTPGTLWFDSASLKLAIWYDDGTSQQWITV